VPIGSYGASIVFLASPVGEHGHRRGKDTEDAGKFQQQLGGCRAVIRRLVATSGPTPSGTPKSRQQTHAVSVAPIRTAVHRSDRQLWRVC
jgi:hypothetical protein